MTDAATTEPSQPTNRRRLLLVLGAVLIVVIALVVGSFLYAASAAKGKASDYDDAYAAWKAKDKPVLLAATAKVPSTTFPIKGDVYTAKSRRSQKQGCDAVAASRKDIAAAADRLPTIDGGGLLGTVSSDYSDAGDHSVKRQKVVKAYVKRASAALAQIERDCRFNIKVNSTSAAYSKVFNQATKYLLKRGQSEGNGSCTSFDTCVSPLASKKNKYADLRLKATRMYESTGLKLWTSSACTETSFKTACRTIGQAYTASTKQQLKNYRYVRTSRSAVNNPGISKGNKKLDKIAAQGQKRIRKAVLALGPAYAKDKKVRRSPGWTENFFTLSARILLDDLADERAALGKL
ncbi:hypothetical protein ASC61_13105 [Aeromicrobium sp. Root344]|uniref:hypothetical protein n=1 Tax=Aeromicrobium sp. Root344 TaxID=1736521 RepID=UPI0006F26567|nr:hypothetical protein [Aeromicrobium sp. Root344]KQV75869.1 hypothetical protein ASC61_13105 [Aeromicrobium sp. Root344]